MESEPGAQAAATANSVGTTSTTTAAATGMSTAASSGSATSSSSAAPNSSSSGGGGSSTTAASIPATTTGGSSSSTSSSTSSSSTTTGRQAVPQISVYSGIPDRQTVQVGVTIQHNQNHILLFCELDFFFAVLVLLYFSNPAQKCTFSLIYDYKICLLSLFILHYIISTLIHCVYYSIIAIIVFIHLFQLACVSRCHKICTRPAGTVIVLDIHT